MPISPVPSSPHEEEAALAARVAAGDEEALQELHRRYAPLVFHLACKSLDRAAAEEITQDVFLAVWRKAGTHDPARGTLRLWLLSIAHHRILDELRSRSRRPGQPPAAEGLEVAAQDPLPDEALWKDYQRQAIAEALAALPEAQRKALSLAFFAELSHEGVAEALKLPLGTVKTRIRSGLRGLSARLAALVAALLLLLPGGWFLKQRQQEAGQKARALDLLANSHLQILKLYPPSGANLGENGTHAAFRGIPGRDLAVLTLSHFPPPPVGQHYVLWLHRDGATSSLALPDPDRDGKALRVLEGLQGWPTGLTVTAETGRPILPSGPVVVRWSP